MMEPEGQITAGRAIASVDRLLIVAAAGLSISTTLPNNVYHSARDFAHHYPTVASYGSGAHITQR